MSRLAIYEENGERCDEAITEHAQIAHILGGIGVRFERWQADAPLSADAAQEEVLQAYDGDVKRLTEEYGFQSLDVVSLTPDNPKREEFRQKFLAEHTHSDFEVRFFVEGRGLFYLHLDEKVYLVLCERGDLISVPAGVKHWFDMGSRPDFKCIRLFVIPDGWVGDFTGDTIAARFPTFDEFTGEQ